METEQVAEEDKKEEGMDEHELITRQRQQS